MVDRQSIVAAVSGALATTSARTVRARLWDGNAVTPEECPAAFIGLARLQAQGTVGENVGPQLWTVTVNLYLVVNAGSQKIDPGPVLDDFLAEVEVALARDPTLGGAVLNSRIASEGIDPNIDGVGSLEATVEFEALVYG